MTEADDWWAAKMGQPVQQRQMPVYAPQMPYQQPQAPQYQQAPQYAPGAPQGQHQASQLFPPGSITPENIGIAAQYWEGGKGTKTETQACPQCGGNHYFSRRPEGPSRLPPPAPMCADCGYTGLFYQSPDMPTTPDPRT